MIACKKDDNTVYSECEIKFIHSWNVKDHFIAFENDSLVSEYIADYSLQFIPGGTGLISHPAVDSQSFDWECSGDTLSISNGMLGPLWVESGNYNLVNESDSTLTLEKHVLFDGIGGKIETWRTWNFSLK